MRCYGKKGLAAFPRGASASNEGQHFDGPNRLTNQTMSYDATLLPWCLRQMRGINITFRYSDFDNKRKNMVRSKWNINQRNSSDSPCIVEQLACEEFGLSLLRELEASPCHIKRDTAAVNITRIQEYQSHHAIDNHSALAAWVA